MKGSKKYIGHEYNFTSPAKSGLGKELGAVKAKSSELRKVKKYDGGGTIQSGISQAASAGGVPHTQVNTMGSVASGLAGAFGKAKGGKIKAANKEQKAEVKEDSPKNDKIPILASEGEIMVPKSKTKDPKKAAKFVKEEIEKNKK